MLNTPEQEKYAFIEKTIDEMMELAKELNRIGQGINDHWEALNNYEETKLEPWESLTF